LAALLFSFGPLIPWLGFYWDDWPVILFSQTGKMAGLWDFFTYNRPFSVWSYALLAPLLGTSPLPWHLFTLLVRWLVALAFWWALHGVWPGHGRVTTWAAVLFAVYPAFTLQPIAVAFNQHWIAFALFLFSLGAMLHAAREQGNRPRRATILTLLALPAAALHLLSMEYFVGLELLRPALLWKISSERGIPKRQVARQVFRQWLPYLAILGTYGIWRVFVLDLAGQQDVNRPDLFFNLLNDPLPTLAGLVETVFKDSVGLLTTPWQAALQTDTLSLFQPVALFSILLTVLVAILAVAYLMSLRLSGQDPAVPASSSPGLRLYPSRSFSSQVIKIGLLAVLLGVAPVWAIERQAFSGLYGSRFALAAMPGLSLLAVGVLEWLTPRRRAKIVLIAVMVGLAAGFHVRTADLFRLSWQKQRNFYWQLHWRVPSLDPGTALLSDGELFPYVGWYSTMIGLNLLYPQDLVASNLGYGFFDLHDDFPQGVDTLLAGDAKLRSSLQTLRFNGKSGDSLAIFYQPEEGRCLWVLGPDDQMNPDIPEITRSVLPVSDLKRIGAEPASGYPPTSIFGAEPEHSWCYYYQKIELARQTGDWARAADLGEEALAAGFQPADRQEWLPLIESFARAGFPDQALEVTETAVRLKLVHKTRLCDLWDRLEDGQTLTGALQKDRLEFIRHDLECGS
jgi:hypothetical protein